MSSLLLIGGGGHCLAVIDSLNRTDFDKVGIIDTLEKVNQTISNIPVVGCDTDLSSLRDEYDSAFISLGSIGNWKKRRELANKLKDFSYHIPLITHVSAIISTSSNIGYGTLVGSSANLNACSDIAEMCIINTGSVIEHQCIIGAYTHIAPGAVLCANVTVGIGSHIGAGSVIKQGVTVGENVIVGIGSVVTHNIPGNVVAYGNPCRIIRKREN